MHTAQWKVMVVDDEPNNLRLMGQILKEKYQLSFAADSTKALDIARKIVPDIILLDIMMPGMDGYETCRRLKAHPVTAKIPVIFVSALGETEDERKGFEIGAVDYITKPVSPPIVLARVAAHLALYDQNRVLEDQVNQRTAELSRALDTIKNDSVDTIRRLSMAAEYKDRETGAHILRMSHYSAAIARRIGMDGEAVASILAASPMHDIGKIGIPDHILMKPGRLTPEEWVIMKQHTAIGARILGQSDKDFIKLSADIALTHHEKWDGSGYPNGLKGDRIPLAGRIIAVADVFDALTSRRPYKDPFPVEKSLDMIRAERGRHFDPEVLDAFLGIREEILAIKDTYRDELYPHISTDIHIRSC